MEFFRELTYQKVKNFVVAQLRVPKDLHRTFCELAKYCEFQTGAL